MSYEKLYQISFFVATLFALTTYSSNLETIERVYWAKNEVKASTGVLETKKDWSKNLPKITWKIEKSYSMSVEKSIKEKSKDLNEISALNATAKKQTTVKVISKTVSPVKSSTEQKIIYRNWWNDPRVQYAYNISGGDMDFIKTIEAESKWDVNALWDKGKSFWLCQIHKGYNSAMQKAYRALKTDNEKVKMCYDQYKDWVKRWVIKTRLYWFNVRNKPQNKNSFTIK